MIRVKHGAIAAAPHKRSSFECVLDKRGAHMLGDRPPHQAPGTAIDHCRHVQQLACPRGRYVTSPTYLVLASVAVKSRSSRPVDAVSAGSGIVVRCLRHSRNPFSLSPR